MRYLFAMTLCAGLLASRAEVLAQPVPPPLPGDPRGALPPPPAGQRLLPPGLPNVSEEQRAPLRDYIEAVAKARQDTAARQDQAKRAVADAIFAEKFDEQAIRARMDELAKVEADYQVARAAAFAKVRPVLTTEQIEVMKSNFDDGMRTRLHNVINRSGLGQDGVAGAFKQLPGSVNQPGVQPPFGTLPTGITPPLPKGPPSQPK